MLSETTASSDSPSRCLISARSELPCAATSTVRAGAQVRHDRVVPVRQHPDDDVGQALGARDGVEQVARSAGRRPGCTVVVGQRRRRHVVGPAPEHELLLAELGPDLRLVLALQRAVVALVEPPDRRTGIQCRSAASRAMFGGADRPAQHRGVHDVGQQAVLARSSSPPRAASASPLSVEVDVDPAGEQVLAGSSRSRRGGAAPGWRSLGQRLFARVHMHPTRFAGTLLIGRSLRSFRFSALTRLRCSLTRIILPKRYGAMPRRMVSIVNSSWFTPETYADTEARATEYAYCATSGRRVGRSQRTPPGWLATRRVFTRQRHSRLIDDPKPSCSRALNAPSAYSRTAPRIRSSSSGVIAASGT